MDKIRNEYIRGTAQVGRFEEKTREARVRWYGHVLRKDYEYNGRMMLRMELPGKRKRGRPKRRFMDVVKEDMAEVEVTEEDTEDRNKWRWKIRCGYPWWEKAERRRFLETSSDILVLDTRDIVEKYGVYNVYRMESHGCQQYYNLYANGSCSHEEEQYTLNPHKHQRTTSSGLVSSLKSDRNIFSR